MDAYRLNRLITIEKATVSQNDMGTPVETFSTLKTTYATVSFSGGGTRSDEYGENSYSDADFTIRYDSRVNYKCRVLFNGTYKITHIELIGRNEGLRLRTIMYENE